MKRTMPRKLKCYGIPAGITVNMAVVVTLFRLQEGKKRAYEGQGRTLAVYSLVVSCLLFLALVFGTAGYCVRKGLEEGEGRIRLDEEAE